MRLEVSRLLLGSLTRFGWAGPRPVRDELDGGTVGGASPLLGSKFAEGEFDPENATIRSIRRTRIEDQGEVV